MELDITFFANLCSAIACIIMVAIGFLKKKDHIVIGQCFQLAFLGAGNFLFGAISGAIGNFLGVIRNLILPKSKKPLVWKIVFIVIQIILSVAFFNSTINGYTGDNVNVLKIIYWIPVLYTITLTCVLDTKNVNVFRVAIMIAQAIFCFFDGFYGNWFAFLANILTVLSNGYSIFADARAAKKAKA
ncbi:MAG: YgjV family protein [Oscillospiraceae bacterium]|nr:YgjV family protein [Oscillospiraceae bacterium]